MLTECLNCPSIWGIGSEEWEDQHCSACGWRVGNPVDDDLPNDVDDDDWNDNEWWFDEDEKAPNNNTNL